MEHLGPLSVDGSRSSRTPQGSPRMVRSMSKGKINRRSVEIEDMTSRFYFVCVCELSYVV